MELRPKAQLFVQIWNCNTMIPSFLRQKNPSNWIVKDVKKKTYLNISWNYKLWGTAIQFKSTLVSSVCENCTSRKLFAIYPKDSKSLMIWKKFQIFGLSIFPDFFCCFYWISRASAYLQAMKVRFTCQNVIFVHISNFSKTEVSAAKVLFFIRNKVFTYNNYYF